MPIKTDTKSIVRRYRSLHSGAANWRSLWQEITTYMSPRKSVVTMLRSPGSKRHQGTIVYDSTAQDSAFTLQSSIHGSLSSSTSRWFVFEADPELMEDEEVRLWLERSGDFIFRKLQQSNLDSEIQESYGDDVTIGTSALLIEDFMDPDAPGQLGGFQFLALAPGLYVIAENAKGEVDTLMREVEMSIRAAVEKWGLKSFPDRIKSRYETEPDEMIKILHAIYPRQGAPSRVEPGTKATKLPFASDWIMLDPEHPVSEGGYHEFPVAVSRWSKQSGELYGRGPGEIALADTKTLNEGVKLRLQGWALAVRPPMKARHRGVIGRVKMTPASVNIVRDMNDLAPIEFGSRFDVANFNEDKYRESIRATFFNDKLTLPNKSIITATEANQRVRQMQRILGPALGRLDHEKLRKIVSRTFRISLRSGALDPIPQALLAAAGGSKADIAVTFVGPLARAQRVQELEAMGEFVQGTLPLAQVFPEIPDLIDPDAYVYRAARATSMPHDIIRGPKAVKKIRKARIDAQNAAREQQGLLDAAKAIGQAGPALQGAQEMQNPFDAEIGGEAA
jgi:hypothetical protein